MTYEEFKKELYRNVSQREEAKHKKIKLLERRMICTDADSIRIIKLINFTCYGAVDLIVREDMLCIYREQEDLTDMKHWRVRPLYERFLKEGWQSVLPEIVMKLQDAGKAGETWPIWNENYEQSRGRHIVKVMNYYYNRKELENCVYWRFGDIAMVLYLLLFDDPNDCMTMKMNRGMTEKWEMQDAVILTNALFNTRAKMPPRLFHGDDIYYRYREQEGIFMPDDGPVNIRLHGEDELEGIHGYRLTTNRWMNGAVALFYPCIKERLSQMIGGDYFVGFTSIHEAVIHPVRHKILGEMKAAIQHNNAVFDEREVLTNRVYRYCSARRELIEV